MQGDRGEPVGAGLILSLSKEKPAHRGGARNRAGLKPAPTGEGVPAWVGGYVGIPWKLHGRDRDGVDCWGLVRLVLMERAGIELPAYETGYATAGRDEADALDGMFAAGLDEMAALYVEVAHRGAATACPLGRERELDVLLLRTFGRRMHIGVVVGGRRMLHIQKGIDACHEAYDGLEWRGRIEAVYRPAALEEGIDRR